ncbi:MAG: BspA family leucine-rich repeat surface protein [Halobacteriovoraceae bacterium]|nr:BspA family leucine-rich repeat surface protein [Halobacteriovoraceae bacterium]
MISIINVSCFNTSKIKTMVKMFKGSHSLKSLNISNFNTQNIGVFSF